VKEREFASFPVELAQVQATGRTLKGLASAFDHPIDSGVRGFPQTTFVRKGAFSKTLKEHAASWFKVLFNHGLDPRYGQLPIGVATRLEENSQGLYAEVELHDGPDNQNIIAALASGALNAMSIQFEVTDEAFNDDRSERYIQALKLYEFGPVTFPANEAATASLHSLPDFVSALTHTADSERDQTEASSDEGRESTLDVDRLTWGRNASRKLEAEDESLEAMAARLRRLRRP
jgi:HK97 family phage prohead protease